MSIYSNCKQAFRVPLLASEKHATKAPATLLAAFQNKTRVRQAVSSRKSDDSRQFRKQWHTRFGLTIGTLSVFLFRRLILVVVLLAIASMAVAETDSAADKKKGSPAGPSRASVVRDAKQTGGEPDGIVQVANLVYAGTKSSRCFSDHFLVRAEKESAISTSRRFHAVKLGSDDIFEFPLLIMTGEGTFQLSDRERENLRRYVEHGGLLLASSGCSSTEWDRSFRREMVKIFPKHRPAPIAMNHPLFHTVYEIKQVVASHGKPRPLLGVSIGGRLGVVYSPDGLNDTGHTQGCCCCGGNELQNAEQINVNVLAYALTY